MKSTLKWFAIGSVMVLLPLIVPGGSLSYDACDHTNLHTLEVPAYQRYTPYNPEEHQMTLQTAFVCDTCGDVVQTDIESVASEAHEWANGACSLCAEELAGYEEAITDVLLPSLLDAESATP